jgi:two-component system sensor histidine kinase RegB
MDPSRSVVPANDIDARTAINVRGVIALRWVAVSGQLLTILAVQLALQIPLPLLPLLAVIGATAALNVALMIVYRLGPGYGVKLTSYHWQQLLGLTMLFDLAALTALLYLTGGITNPFCLFYFVNIVLAAIVLTRPWVWGLMLFGVLGIGLLTIDYRPLLDFDFTSPKSDHVSVGISISRLGIYIAYTTCSSVIVLFITRIRGQLEILEDQVRQLAKAQARSDRLDSLGTLAAGAAHELATPLSTIAVITKEIEQELIRRTVSDQTVADVAIIRTELDRCRDILDRMSNDAGLVLGESISTITVGELIRECCSGVDPRTPVTVVVDPAIEPLVLRAPLEGLSQAIRAIVKNAIDATGRPQDVNFRASVIGSKILLKIEDHGVGIDSETLRRIGEPFFTTKEPGKGMGLGVYLARNVVERLGGTMEYASKPGCGTVVSITIPQDCAPRRDFENDKVGFKTILF